MDALKLLGRLCPEHMVRYEWERCLVDLVFADSEYSESGLCNRTERCTSAEGITFLAINNILLLILNARNCHIVHEVTPPVNMESPKSPPPYHHICFFRVSISMRCSCLSFSSNFYLHVFSTNFFSCVLYVQCLSSFLSWSV